MFVVFSSKTYLALWLIYYNKEIFNKEIFNFSEFSIIMYCIDDLMENFKIAFKIP